MFYSSNRCHKRSCYLTPPHRSLLTWFRNSASVWQMIDSWVELMKRKHHWVEWGGWRDATGRDVIAHNACSRDAFVVWYLKPRRYRARRSERFWEEPLGVSNGGRLRTVSVCESTCQAKSPMKSKYRQEPQALYSRHISVVRSVCKSETGHIMTSELASLPFFCVYCTRSSTTPKDTTITNIHHSLNCRCYE